jgi:hypothetical protein
MGWADYGFPDITMMPCYLPARALYLAVKERMGILYDAEVPWPINYVAPPDKFTEEGGWNFSQGSYGVFAGHGWGIGAVNQTYINQLADLSLPMPGTHAYNCALFWSESDIRDIIITRDTTGIGYLAPTTLLSIDPLWMLPEWSKVWMQQRYLAYNLLKILVVPAKVTYREGHSGDYVPFDTPEDAYSAACANSTVSAPSTKVGMSSTTLIKKGIQGLPNKYAARIYRTETVGVDYDLYPHLLGLPAHLYLRVKTGGPYIDGYNPVFDAHGMGVNDASQVYSKIPLPYIASGIVPPDHGIIEGAFGFETDKYSSDASSKNYAYVGVDVSSLFEFYDNVDEIPTP